MIPNDNSSRKREVEAIVREKWDPILQMRKPKHWEVKKLVQGYTASKKQCQNSNSGSPTQFSLQREDIDIDKIKNRDREKKAKE